MENINFDSLKRRRDLRIILPVFLVSIIACIDRVNISYAKLTMTQTLGWLSPEVYGFGAGIFFAGYLLLEIPGSLFAAKFSASKWIARIMFTWGAVSLCMAFVSTQWQFYLCRFLLGASEASLYPVIYSLLFPRWFTAAERARATSLMLTSLLLSTIVGAPIAGVLLEHSFFGLLGWQELFILESIPALIFAFYFLLAVKDRPDQVHWLTGAEKEYLTNMYEQEQRAMQHVKKYTVLQAFTDAKVLKLCFIYFLWVVGFWGFYFWMPTVLKNLSGWSTSLIGGAIAIPMAAALVVQLIIGHTATVTGDKVWHVFAALTVGAVGLGRRPVSHLLVSHRHPCIHGRMVDHSDDLPLRSGRCRFHCPHQFLRQPGRHVRAQYDGLGPGPDRELRHGLLPDGPVHVQRRPLSPDPEI